ncbi:hypothetical protein DFQ26_009155 [Actinomortierella ambigua]|nr:hypothetical protein DFQ26_009155 [Actinomortierella ambigua]
MAVSAASVAVVTKNGIYHHIERREVLPATVGEASADSAGTPWPHSPYTPKPGSGGGEGGGGSGELQPGPSKKKKRSGFLSELKEDGEPDAAAAAVAPTVVDKDAGDGKHEAIFGDNDEVVATAFQSSLSSSGGARLKDQGADLKGQIDFVGPASNAGKQQQQQHRAQKQESAKEEEQEENDDHHRHEVKGGVAASGEKFEHMDIWNEDDDEEAASGLLQPTQFPSRDLFGENAEEVDADIRVAPEHIAHSEHDYLDDSDEDGEDEDGLGNDNDNDDNNNDDDDESNASTTIEWSVDEWEEEFDGDLADWSDWIDEHDELERQEPEMTMKIKVKVMGHARLVHTGDEEKNKDKDESPYQRLFSESWF